MTRPRPTTRAPKPNQQERAQRELVIDNLIGRALRGHLTIPEAALLADYIRADRRNAQQTRQSLTDTTRALERHREAARTAIREAEQRAEQAETELAELRTVARGYCPACGRGDAAPTVEDWEQQKQRAERAEAAITRVRAIAGWAANDWADLSPDKILAALDPPAPAAEARSADKEQP
ncbi:hypothetical protein [Streptomyces sp. BK340]|uniref:hypothetical protein n=1 Tax=Streptomyces sp. BK340 TaxID=2572903 RepID=UPI0011AD0D55|nr:hypothetical protein [Streptomyces sp. BK340]TVZ96489.1 hypothetical protein FB157_103400 [Streptomyces sp. BK340]